MARNQRDDVQAYRQSCTISLVRILTDEDRVDRRDAIGNGYPTRTEGTRSEEMGGRT